MMPRDSEHTNESPAYIEEKGKTPEKVAFVCTGNTCRSPMAEGVFNKLAAEKGLAVRAESFGIAAANGQSASQNAVIACREIGVDLSDKTAHFVYDVNLKAFDKFYCMSQGHAAALAGMLGVDADKISVLNVSDPFGGDLEIYRRCRDEILKAAENILKAYEN